MKLLLITILTAAGMLAGVLPATADGVNQEARVVHTARRAPTAHSAYVCRAYPTYGYLGSYGEGYARYRGYPAFGMYPSYGCAGAAGARGGAVVGTQPWYNPNYSTGSYSPTYSTGGYYHPGYSIKYHYPLYSD